MVETDIATAIINAGYAEAIGTDIFTGYEPATPDRLVVVREYGGPEGERIQNKPGIAYELPYLQILTRGNREVPGEYNAIYNKAYNIYLALGAIQNVFLPPDEVWYRKIIPIQKPHFLARDENQRPRFIFNIRVERSPEL